METFGCGDRVVRASSIELGRAIIEALDRSRFHEQQRRDCEEIHYGHNFNPCNRKCGCGLGERDFDNTKSQYRWFDLSELHSIMCPIWVEKHVPKRPKPQPKPELGRDPMDRIEDGLMMLEHLKEQWPRLKLISDYIHKNGDRLKIHPGSDVYDAALALLKKAYGE